MSACNALLAAFLSLPLSRLTAASSADHPPHDLALAADGGGLVLHVQPQRDELVLDAVVIVLIAVLLLCILLGGLDDLPGGVFDVARAKEHQRRFPQAATAAVLIRENCRDTGGGHN